nr:7661_t:CDS:1 [Entrophospora candida]
MSSHQQIQQQQTHFNNCQQSSEIHYSSNHHQFETNNLPFLNGDYIDVNNNNIMTSSQQPLLFSSSQQLQQPLQQPLSYSPRLQQPPQPQQSSSFLPPQQQQFLYVNNNNNSNNDGSPSLNPTLNFNANLTNINNIPLSNSINDGTKYDNNSLILSISHRMSLIKDYSMKINQCHFEMEQIINYLKNQNQ